jgi:hypothetical protein
MQTKPSFFPSDGINNGCRTTKSSGTFLFLGWEGREHEGAKFHEGEKTIFGFWICAFGLKKRVPIQNHKSKIQNGMLRVPSRLRAFVFSFGWESG